MIKDMFETITLYDNYVDKVEVKALENGKYEVKIKAIVSKYRAGEKGEKMYKDEDGKTLTYENEKKVKIESMPLEDYIEIGVFAKEYSVEKEERTNEKVLYLQKVKVISVENEFTVVVDEKPSEVGVDPYNKLIDTRSYDNRKAL